MRWSLLTLTHELSHVIIRAILAELLPDLRDDEGLRHCISPLTAPVPPPTFSTNSLDSVYSRKNWMRRPPDETAIPPSASIFLGNRSDGGGMTSMKSSSTHSTTCTFMDDLFHVTFLEFCHREPSPTSAPSPRLRRADDLCRDGDYSKPGNEGGHTREGRCVRATWARLCNTAATAVDTSTKLCNTSPAPGTWGYRLKG